MSVPVGSVSCAVTGITPGRNVSDRALLFGNEGVNSHHLPGVHILSMIKDPELIDRLVAEALQHPFSGWDFSFLDRRWRENSPTWDYRQSVLERLPAVTGLLDMGTGGGEFLSTLAPLPEDTWATESYPPNFPLARARLEPLRVRVVQTRSDNDLPFEDNRFELVINRHSSYSPQEVHRILKPNGTFITQQVGGRNNIRLNELLQDRVEFEFAYWNLRYAIPQLEDAGHQVVVQQEEFPEAIFYDIGAVVYYLRAIPWQIANFTVEKYCERLMAIHNMIQEVGGLVVHSHRFYIQATKQ